MRLLCSDLHWSRKAALLGMATIRTLFEVHVHFFHEKLNTLLGHSKMHSYAFNLFAFLFYIAIITDGTRAFSQGGKLIAERGPLAKTRKKILRNDGESGCG